MQDILYYETYTPHYYVTLDGKHLHREAYPRCKEEYHDESTYDDRHGYYCVHHFSIHRLVVEAYRRLNNLGPIPPKTAIDHIDTNKHNNDISNLRVCTPKENCNNPLTRKHLSESLKGRVFTEEWRRHLSESCIGRTSPIKGKKLNLSQEQRQSISDRWKKFYRENDTWNKGLHLSEEHRVKVADGTREAMANLSEEKRQRLREGGYNTRGRKWIMKGSICKRVYENEIEYYVSLGWSLGRTINKSVKLKTII